MTRRVTIHIVCPNQLFVLQVLLPLLQTLAYLHKEGIMHRDGGTPQTITPYLGYYQAVCFTLSSRYSE